MFKNWLTDINFMQENNFPIVKCQQGWSDGNMDPAHWGVGEIDALLVPPGTAFKLLTDHLITG